MTALSPMTSRAMAALHKRCFTTPRPWTEEEFAAQLQDPAIVQIGDGPGFALARMAVDEAEVLTIAVDPPHQGRGLGAAILSRLEHACAAQGAARMVLEVSAENGAARALYAAQGYTQVGKRTRYYRRPDGARVDALVLARALSGDP